MPLHILLLLYKTFILLLFIIKGGGGYGILWTWRMACAWTTCAALGVVTWRWRGAGAGAGRRGGVAGGIGTFWFGIGIVWRVACVPWWAWRAGLALFARYQPPADQRVGILLPTLFMLLIAVLPALYGAVCEQTSANSQPPYYHYYPTPTPTPWFFLLYATGSLVLLITYRSTPATFTTALPRHYCHCDGAFIGPTANVVFYCVCQQRWPASVFEPVPVTLVNEATFIYSPCRAAVTWRDVVPHTTHLPTLYLPFVTIYLCLCGHTWPALFAFIYAYAWYYAGRQRLCNRARVTLLLLL